MAKKTVIIISLILLTSCDSYKSMFIFSRFTIKPNSNLEAFRIIDTTSIYKEVELVNLTYNTKLNLDKREYINYIRFKKSGEMVRLLTDKLTDWQSRESELKRMQRYNYSEKGFYIEYHFHTVQGGWSIWKSKLIKHSNDSLIFRHKNYITKYVRTAIPVKQ
ncbi:hypothetical protein [Aquimarina acroporae]|uniref:hypothetical protein n=1 Tax=Aquimarina acroporae TaxID=2937283 RepID=UPI0020C0DD90|nr:hypothetical protein [Aquimarina acroporae]